MQSFVKYVIFKLNKKLKIGFLKPTGRNFSGRICVHHQGGALKRNNYLVDFFKRINSFGIVVRIIKSSLYTSYLGLVIYLNGLSSYILLSDKIKENNVIFSGTFSEKLSYSIGYSLPLSYLPLFSLVNNVELYPYSGSVLARAAGMSALVISKLNNKVVLKLKSGWNLTLSNNCICSYGQSSNPLHSFERIGKAGKARALGVRPTVRGVAMNPCDHPHGGGEGKKSPPVAARSPWGWLTKGTPSKSKKKFLLKKKKYKLVR